MSNHADPSPADGVRGVARLAACRTSHPAAGVHTISDLVTRINRKGHRFWKSVPHFGTTAAARVLRWLTMNDASLGLNIAPYALTPVMVG